MIDPVTEPSNWTPQSPSPSMRLWTELIPIEMASIKVKNPYDSNPRLVHALSPQGLFSNARVLAKGPSVKTSNTTSMRPAMMAQMIMLSLIIDLTLLDMQSDAIIYCHFRPALALHGHSSEYSDWFVQPSVPSQPALLLDHPRKLDYLVGVPQP